MAQSRIEMLWMINVFLVECFGNPFNGKGGFNTHLDKWGHFVQYFTFTY